MENVGVLWRLVEICLLRAGPQDLPATTQFLALALAGYFLVDVLILQLGFPLSAALAASLLDVLLMAAFVQILLRVVAKPERFPQTLAALAGTGQLLGLLAWPLIKGMVDAEAGADSASGLALLRLALLAWSLVVTGHIVRHAMSTSLAMGVGIAVLYNLLSIMIVSAVFPAAG